MRVLQPDVFGALALVAILIALCPVQPSNAAGQTAGSHAEFHSLQGIDGTLDPALDLPRIPSQFPQRHPEGAVACSLQRIVRENLEAGGCHMRSRLDKQYGIRGDQRLWVNFGEVNCTVVLKQCQKKACYRIYDFSSTDKMDGEVPRQRPSSIFKDFRVIRGGQVLHWDKTGVQFQPSEEEMEFQYSTHTCHDFYSYRGGVTPQLCGQPAPLISDAEQLWLQNCAAAKSEL